MFDMIHIYCTFVCMRNFSKVLTTYRVIAKFKSLTPPEGSGGRGKILITVMLIYRHWVIMTYSEKLSDIIVLKKCEVYSTQKANIAFALA